MTFYNLIWVSGWCLLWLSMKFHDMSFHGLLWPFISFNDFIWVSRWCILSLTITFHDFPWSSFHFHNLLLSCMAFNDLLWVSRLGLAENRKFHPKSIVYYQNKQANKKIIITLMNFCNLNGTFINYLLLYKVYNSSSEKYNFMIEKL